jgi:BirA family biotin operon repressor/biotin-[acetyl-CoA-carboxylase] ligase
MSEFSDAIRRLRAGAGTFGRELEYLESVDSTNRGALERAGDGAPEGTTVVAETQLAGRGRRGRTWVSPSGINLYCSVILRPRVVPARMGQLPLVAAVALHRALSGFAPAVTTLIKWPNDILAGGGKLAGILCEADIEAGAVRHAVAGIGINVNARTFPAELAGIATSLARESGAEHSRPDLLAAVLHALEEDYRRWCADPDLTGFLPYLEEHSALLGRSVLVEGPDGGRTGRVEGISPDGELLLRDAGGRTLKITSGNVRVVSLSPAAG